LKQAFGPAAQPYIDEARHVAGADADGLCEADGDDFVIPPPARPFTRIVAARFDAYLNHSSARYSRAV
jgi:oxygen-independent coproporphyrinogen-3 oxidase